MIFAGPIEVPTSFIITVLVVLALGAIVICVTGGALAWAISGQPRAVWLGALLFGAIAGLLLTLEPWLAAACGYAACVGLGLALRTQPRRS